MANPYYNRSNAFTSGTTARGSEVRNEYDAVEGGFDDLAAEVLRIDGDISSIQAGDPPGFGGAIDTRWFITDTTQSTSAYEATPSPAPLITDVLSDGYTIEFLANNNNVGAATLNIGSSEGAIPIVKVSGPVYVPLDDGDISTLNVSRLTFLNGNWVKRSVKVPGVPTGVFFPYGGSTPPDDYLLCDGAEISRTTYLDLFLVLGTAYGIGDGVNTFNLPDLRGRVAAGPDNMGGLSADTVTATEADAVGGTYGAETHTLLAAETPIHTHTTGAGGGAASVTTTAAGSHTHVIAADGIHSHSGSTGSDSHSHSFSGNTGSNTHSHTYSNRAQVSSTTATSGGSALGNIQTSNTSSYSHSHSYSGTTGADSHNHSVSIGNSLSHTHGVDTVAAHTHDVTVADHDHTVSSFGGGGAHNNMQPTLFTNWIIRT